MERAGRRARVRSRIGKKKVGERWWKDGESEFGAETGRRAWNSERGNWPRESASPLSRRGLSFRGVTGQ